MSSIESPQSDSPPASASIDCRERVCVIGAGSSGLAAVRNLRAQDIPVDCLERDADIGGIWQYGKSTTGIYASTHLISSKRLTEFPDFRLPKEYPHYPSHEQVFAYFQDYARHFDLYKSIEFNTPVERVERVGDYWRVVLTSGEQRDYGGLVIANGHNWDPRLPDVAGEFNGLSLHSRISNPRHFHWPASTGCRRRQFWLRYCCRVGSTCGADAAQHTARLSLSAEISVRQTNRSVRRTAITVAVAIVVAPHNHANDGSHSAWYAGSIRPTKARSSLV